MADEITPQGQQLFNDQEQTILEDDATGEAALQLAQQRLYRRPHPVLGNPIAPRIDTHSGEPPPTVEQLNLERVQQQLQRERLGHAPAVALPIHEVLLDEEAPASALVREHLTSLSDEELEQAAQQLELQQIELAAEPEKSSWVQAGWDPEHAATMLACSARATYKEIARRSALPKEPA